jgi:hypothetical protein
MARIRRDMTLLDALVPKDSGLCSIQLPRLPRQEMKVSEVEENLMQRQPDDGRFGGEASWRA